MRYLMFTALALVLAGCTQTTWYKPGSTEQTYNTDSYECERDSRQSNMLPGFASGFDARGFYERCMKARGWSNQP